MAHAVPPSRCNDAELPEVAAQCHVPSLRRKRHSAPLRHILNCGNI